MPALRAISRFWESDALGSLLGLAASDASPIGDLAFYRLILTYLRRQIDIFGIDLLTRVGGWVSGMVLVLMTIWVFVQGYRIISGQLRSSMSGFVLSAARNVFIVSAATTLAVAGSDVHRLVTHGLKSDVSYLVTGDAGGAEASIDRNLAWMQLALSTISAVDVNGDEALDREKARAMWSAGLGSGAPALVGGAMLLLYDVALALFVGLGPMFILCLLFEQTKSLFHRWILYGIGTIFSMAVLAAMVAIALRMVERVAEAFWSAALIDAVTGDAYAQGMSAQAMQQGGLGVILTVLIVSAPPIAAMFFQGTLGHFSWANAFGSAAGGLAGARQQGGYAGSAGMYPASRQTAISTEQSQQPAATPVNLHANR